MTAWMEGLLKRRERAESFRESLRDISAERRKEAAAEGAEHHAPTGEEDPRARRIRQILDARRNRFSKARRILQDPERCAFILVMIPEKLAILEGHRAYRTLVEAGIPVTGAVVNRVLPERELGDFLESRRRQEHAYLEEIDRKFARIPRKRVPLLEEDVGNVAGLRSVARVLSSSVGA
jgi:arsenite-transporting ATPase